MWVCGGLIMMRVLIDKAFYSRDIRRELPTYTVVLLVNYSDEYYIQLLRGLVPK